MSNLVKVDSRGRRKAPMWLVGTQINNTKVSSLFDTGADCSLCDPRLIKKLNLTKHIKPATGSYCVQGAFSGKPQAPQGEIDLRFSIGNQLFNHRFIVTKLSCPDQLVIGQDFWFFENFEARYEDGHVTLSLNGHTLEVKPVYTETESNLILQLEPDQVKIKPKILQDGEVQMYRNSHVKADAYTVVKVVLPDTAVVGTKVIIECDPKATNIIFPDQLRPVLAESTHKEHGSMCQGVKSCVGCKKYKFTYVKVKNATSGNLTLRKGETVGFASLGSKTNKSEVRRACHITAKKSSEFANDERIKQILLLLGDRCPDRPQMVHFMENLCSQYPDVIHLEPEALRVTDLVSHHINYDGEPIWVSQYPIPHAKMAGLLKSVERLLAHRSMINADSAYNFPCVPVYKGSADVTGEHEIRICVNYASLNSKTPSDHVQLGI